MRIAAQSQTYTRTAAKSKGPDDVPPEFPERNSEPGPDDVYDPDSNRRGGNDYGGPHYYDGDSGSGGGGGYVLF